MIPLTRSFTCQITHMLRRTRSELKISNQILEYKASLLQTLERNFINVHRRKINLTLTRLWTNIQGEKAVNKEKELKTHLSMVMVEQVALWIRVHSKELISRLWIIINRFLLMVPQIDHSNKTLMVKVMLTTILVNLRQNQAILPHHLNQSQSYKLLMLTI